MAYQYKIRIKELAINLLLICHFIFTEQQESCLLPDGIHQSTCTRVHRCNHFSSILKEYSGWPPQHIVQNINAHNCMSRGYICCPDNATIVSTTITTTTTATTTTSTIPPSKRDSSRMDEDSVWTALKDHPNYNLINEPSCGISTLNRIVGSSNAELKEYPWAVLLGYENKNVMEWGCGGSLISKQFVLTAAHCIFHELTIARLGEHRISTAMDCDEFNDCADPVQDIRIEKKIMHINYSRLGKKDDIALLKLESPADLTKNNVRTICLPTNEESDIEKVKFLKMVITGWGRTETGANADILQKAFVKHVDSKDCAARYSELPNSIIQIFPTNFCAGLQNKTDACKGDSGGGLSTFALVHGRPKMTLYGVIAAGLPCERTDLIYPGIYTNLKYYLSWILDNMSQ